MALTTHMVGMDAYQVLMSRCISTQVAFAGVSFTYILS